MKDEDKKYLTELIRKFTQASNDHLGKDREEDPFADENTVYISTKELKYLDKNRDNINEILKENTYLKDLGIISRLDNALGRRSIDPDEAAKQLKDEMAKRAAKAAKEKEAEEAAEKAKKEFEANNPQHKVDVMPTSNQQNIQQDADASYGGRSKEHLKRNKFNDAILKRGSKLVGGDEHHDDWDEDKPKDTKPSEDTPKKGPSKINLDKFKNGALGNMLEQRAGGNVSIPDRIANPPAETNSSRKPSPASSVSSSRSSSRSNSFSSNTSTPNNTNSGENVPPPPPPPAPGTNVGKTTTTSGSIPTPPPPPPVKMPSPRNTVVEQPKKPQTPPASPRKPSFEPAVNNPFKPASPVNSRPQSPRNTNIPPLNLNAVTNQPKEKSPPASPRSRSNSSSSEYFTPSSSTSSSRSNSPRNSFSSEQVSPRVHRDNTTKEAIKAYKEANKSQVITPLEAANKVNVNSVTEFLNNLKSSVQNMYNSISYQNGDKLMYQKILMQLNREVGNLSIDNLSRKYSDLIESISIKSRVIKDKFLEINTKQNPLYKLGSDIEKAIKEMSGESLSNEYKKNEVYKVIKKAYDSLPKNSAFKHDIEELLKYAGKAIKDKEIDMHQSTGKSNGFIHNIENKIFIAFEKADNKVNEQVNVLRNTMNKSYRVEAIKDAANIQNYKAKKELLDVLKKFEKKVVSKIKDKNDANVRTFAELKQVIEKSGGIDRVLSNPQVSFHALKEKLIDKITNAKSPKLNALKAKMEKVKFKVANKIKKQSKGRGI